MTDFFQTPPSFSPGGNSYLDDSSLASALRRRVPASDFAEIERDLERFGARAATEVQAWGDRAEREVPRHVPYDAWGRRVDRIEVSEGWRALDRISAEERLVAIGYERRHGAASRLHQFAKLYLFHPSSAIYSCPLAMTDGAARAIELYGDEDLKAGAFRRLTSASPEEFWTSGQWMTERTGGSDVSGTSTVARLEDGEYRLYGTKWFTSATTSQMAMTLARTEGAAEGSRGLSLFYVELRDGAGSLRGIRVNRLKDKLGTHALPTAELTLEGTPARLVGGAGDGVKKISALFNITRIYNSVCAASAMRRGLALCEDYSSKRVAFGKRLADLPLHAETLAQMRTDADAALLLVLRAAELLGRDECGTGSPAESAALRLLTPLVKLFTAKLAVAAASEALECFGGAGYVEDTGLPRLLRDTQVLAIWEGTTNVLSLDALRAVAREKALEPFVADLTTRLRACSEGAWAAEAQAAAGALERLLTEFRGRNAAEAERHARSFAMGLARIYAASLLYEQAEWSVAQKRVDSFGASAKRWRVG